MKVRRPSKLAPSVRLVRRHRSVLHLVTFSSHRLRSSVLEGTCPAYPSVLLYPTARFTEPDVSRRRRPGSSVLWPPCVSAARRRRCGNRLRPLVLRAHCVTFFRPLFPDHGSVGSHSVAIWGRRVPRGPFGPFTPALLSFLGADIRLRRPTSHEWQD